MPHAAQPSRIHVPQGAPAREIVLCSTKTSAREITVIEMALPGGGWGCRILCLSISASVGFRKLDLYRTRASEWADLGILQLVTARQLCGQRRLLA